MKKAIIVHGWGASPISCWFQEEKKLLEKRGYKVDVPTMPDTLLPEREKWLKVLKKLKPGKTAILIGHSLGCPTILRYLETAKTPVDKVFLIAPFARDLGIEFVPILDFVKNPFDWEKIKENANKFYVVTQDGDDWTPVEYGIDVAKKLNAELTVVKGDDHLQQSLDLNLINERV